LRNTLRCTLREQPRPRQLRTDETSELKNQDKDKQDKQKNKNSSIHFTLWLSAGFDAWSALPTGTTLSATRPAVRYLFATRFTSAGVTARVF
jgi:hypothetical protein